jgi:cytochrome P450
MLDIFSDDVRRNPFPIYDQLRATSPVLRVPPPFDAWLILDYEGVKRALNDHDAFSSAVPSPRHWFIFSDPPLHTKMRALIAKAFTPSTITNLEPQIRNLSRDLLTAAIARGEIDLAQDYAVPLPMKVISEMIGIPPADWNVFRHWSDVIVKLSYARNGGPEAQQVTAEFTAVAAEMNDYLTHMIAARRAEPRDDLLTRLIHAEVDGETLSQPEILGFFQLLVVGGQDSTANLINNSILCLLDNPDELARLRNNLQLLPSAIEEVLRFRSPFQWIMRTPKRDLQMGGQTIPAGKLVLAVIGSANRDPKIFPDANRFDITRSPNPHIAFGHGIHFCIGGPLARMEARIALTDLLSRFKQIDRANNDPWPPRQALHVHGPSRLPIHFELAESGS